LDILEWTKKTVAEDKSLNSWFTERIYEWVPLCDDAISELMKGTPFLVVTDRQRDWFNYYIINNVNSIKNNRPFVPIYSLMNFIPYSHKTDKIEHLDMIEDMLDITFKENYKYWYIGTEDSNIYRLVQRKEKSFIWLFDKESGGDTFFLKSYTENLDHQLMSLLKLFNQTITASMFGEIEI
jgi:hypothetical protein